MPKLQVPTEVSLQQVVSTGHALSPSLYNQVFIPNPKTEPVRNFLDLSAPYEKGVEPGSLAYLTRSPKFLMRTKALQPHSWLPYPKGDAMVPVNPREIVDGPAINAGDILLSKDSNIGECAIVYDEEFSNCTFSGGIVRLNVARDKYYLLSFLKSDIFKAQLDAVTPKGATIRHAGTLWMDCKIPVPRQQNAEDVVKYVSLMTQAIIEKEVAIRRRNQEIDAAIASELLCHQGEDKFKYRYPDLIEVKTIARLDAGFYSEETQRSLWMIKNYTGSWKPLDQLGFEISRGQNLQVTTIGKSLYSDTPKKNFYRLAAPTDLSEFRTTRRFRYLGNSRKLSVLKKGDVVFGAEGFEKGRTLIIADEVSRTITNIHGIVFSHLGGDEKLSTFLGCYLGYLRKIGLVDAIAAGGSGGSLAIGYLEHVPVPLFPKEKVGAIAAMYTSGPATAGFNITKENFLDWHRASNVSLGIWELDKSMKDLDEERNRALELIIEGEPVALPAWWAGAGSH
jgi:type I restriction enzyme S subunit